MLNLSRHDQCVFNKVIENDLDELNSSRTVILFDHLMIRNYLDREVGMEFSFVKDISTDSMYFIAFPEFDEWVYHVDKHYSPYGDRQRLKEKVHLVQFDNLLFNKFIDHTGILAENDMPFRKKIARLSKLHRDIFPKDMLEWKDTVPMDMLDSLYLASRISTYELDEIKALLDNQITIPNFHSEIFRVFDAGYLVLTYQEIGREKRFIHKMYFIPAYTRGWIVIRTDTPKYGRGDCPDN